VNVLLKRFSPNILRFKVEGKATAFVQTISQAILTLLESELF
jgi:hypothetical protein